MKFYVILICMLSTFSGCSKGESLTKINLENAVAQAKPEYLLENDLSFVFVNSIFDEFPIVKSKYIFSSAEENVLGIWYRSLFFDYSETYRFTIYPNRLGFIWAGLSISDNSVSIIRTLYGIWEIKDNNLNLTIYGYYIYSPKAQNSFVTLEKPVSVKIISVDDINSNGYTTNLSNTIKVPKEIIKGYNFLPKILEGAVYSRHFRFASITSDEQSNLEFKYINEMAELGISGEMIVNDPEKYRKYLEF